MTFVSCPARGDAFVVFVLCATIGIVLASFKDRLGCQVIKNLWSMKKPGARKGSLNPGDLVR